MASLKLHLSDEEYRLLNDAARELGVTRSYIMRLAFRTAVGLPVGESGEDEFRYLATHRDHHSMVRTRSFLD